MGGSLYFYMTGSIFILTQVKAELGGKQDRVNTLRQEIAENERQVE